MTSPVLVDIREEVTCPICLELLTEPLSIDCGHSFCQACITPNSRESMIGQEGERSCPVCQTSYQPGNLRPNRHLANIVRRLREVVLGPGKQLKAVLCADHGEKLQLFCQEDGKVICWLCERSQEHHGHHTFLVEEVAQEYQEKFQESLKKLKNEEQEAEKLTAFIREKKTCWKARGTFSEDILGQESWQNQMEPERHRIQTEFNQLRNILDRVEQRELKKLEEEEKKGLRIIEEAENDLVHQSQSLRELILDLERRCQGSTMELLQSAVWELRSPVLSRSEFWTLRKPEALPTKLRSMFRAPDLKRMLRVFRELTDVQSYWVDVTLNPHTANLNLVLAKNRRQVRFVGAKVSGPSCLEKHYDCSVLGSQHFSSGKHYWEVDVAKKTAWILGSWPVFDVCAIRMLFICTILIPSLSIFSAIQGSLTRRERTASGVRTRRSQGSSAMASKILLNVQEEVTCPICLELLTEPLSLGCGHSLCRACITVSNKEAVTSPGGKSSCPVCGTSYSFENLQVNQHLTNIVERLKEYQVQIERQRIQTEFEQLRSILNSEEQRELQRLEEEEKKRLDKFAEAEDELVQQKQLVRELISDVECRSQWSAMELLQTIFVIPRSEIWKLKKPKKVSKKLKTVFRAPDLSRMLQMFRELTAVQCYWVDVTLNSVNLNLNLVLSEDQRQVMSVPIWPFQCYNYGVLGSQYFFSGKHYWEVDVSKKTAWILGVYCRTYSHNIKYVVRRCANHQNVYSKYRPLFGYWVIGLQNKCKYSAFEESLSSDPEVLTLSMAVPPCRVGVFLDYEAGIVSFFNVTSHGSLIYKFSKCGFSQPVYPYFNPWNCPAPMTLCPPSS
ncbi:hypothetical protein H8959_002724 [Pygathrix nigripes]